MTRAPSPVISRIASGIVTSNTRRRLVQTIAGLPRRLRGTDPVIDYFHQIDDPYSQLIVQLLPALSTRYGVTIRPWLVSPPEDSAAPERERLRSYGVRDAQRVAAEYGLTFPADAALPDATSVVLAGGVLAQALKSEDFAKTAFEVGTALWSRDTAALAALAKPDQSANATLAEGDAERARLGHYLGGMMNFEGAWYWGVDRLNHLEERLAAMGKDTQPGTPMLAPYRDLTLGPVPAGGKPATIEAWFSFRSPYSWIAVPRLRKLAHHYGATLELRYILPMVMRGLPVPRIKSFYIMFDTKREADRVGLPFGKIVDPVGAGAERALAVLHHAVPLGLGEEFSELGTRAAWADGIALAQDDGLYDVARRAGLTDAQTAAALADDSWRQAAEANREALFEAGLWGAPSYRVNGGQAHWGQDRLWALEQDLVKAMRG